MESLAYDSSSTTSPNSIHPGTQGHPHQQRTKRMRTSFKHHQLRTMKSYFAVNQNPDAKDLKQLAQKTGLSKRVLQVHMQVPSPHCYVQYSATFSFPQVWFQNARAKYRRSVMRQDLQTSTNGITILPPRSASNDLSKPSSTNLIADSMIDMDEFNRSRQHPNTAGQPLHFDKLY
jgi:LIM homeobox protein 2/9